MAIRAIATDSQDFNNPSTTGKPGRDERLDFKNEAGDTVFSIVSDADGTASIQGDAVPKVYRALLTQTGTDAPTATVLENTLGGTVVWTRDNPGRYDATLAGAFTENKTATNSGACMTFGTTMLGWFAMERTDSDVMRLITTAVAGASTTADDVLASTYVKITVDR
jgi:hypothetical protein